MLLPSPFTCDPAQPRLQAALFASPPASPPQLSTQNAIGNIFNTCRSLQSLLAAAPMSLTLHTEQPAAEPTTPPTSSHAQLPTPPMTHAVAPQPLKLRLRPRKTESSVLGVAPVPKKRIAKRTPIATRGVNKRRRAMDDDMGREREGRDDDNSDVESDLDISHNGEENMEASPVDLSPSTPKRARIAPEVIPLGLERGDYHALHLSEKENLTNGGFNNEHVEMEKDGEFWSTEEDRILVELVLEKLKLTKSDWQDCARSLGKDRSSLGRRWKSLMISGEIGLKRSGRRGKIHGTWR